MGNIIYAIDLAERSVSVIIPYLMLCRRKGVEHSYTKYPILVFVIEQYRLAILPAIHLLAPKPIKGAILLVHQAPSLIIREQGGPVIPIGVGMPIGMPPAYEVITTSGKGKTEDIPKETSLEGQ